MWLWHSLYEAAAMFWEVLWALIFGFAISAMLQVYVSKAQMTQALGRAGLREVALATAFGAASSSCSYAAVAAARTAFKKGAALVPTLAFMFASTNLVFELGFVLWILMGWRFVLAEGIGAFVLIGVMWMIVSLTLPQGLEDEARAYGDGMDGGHDHSMHSHSAPGSGGLRAVADAFVMDWSMLWKEMLIGFVISGFLAVLVTNQEWRVVFLAHTGSSVLRLLENAVVGPLVAIASFVCSVGNIPLASVLWSGGICFGGVIAFIYADLIILPLIIAYNKYYGRRTAFYITWVLFASMVISGLLVDLLFSALHLIPTGPRPASAISTAHFAWNHTTWLDLPALAAAGILAAVSRRGKKEAAHEADHAPEAHSQH